MAMNRYSSSQLRCPSLLSSTRTEQNVSCLDRRRWPDGSVPVTLWEGQGVRGSPLAGATSAISAWKLVVTSHLTAVPILEQQSYPLTPGSLALSSAKQDRKSPLALTRHLVELEIAWCL